MRLDNGHSYCVFLNFLCHNICDIGSIAYSGFKVLRLKKPKHISPEIKNWKKDSL